ncbi:ribosomal protein l3 containing protein [Stylonychia lemnae]|uniref:Large ribosomal subunit protein uL3m n=1 Tax=Stylonychia lemnae TaxID=5949 RepID=A0A077ZSU2_STYLE|nr:ribosomal protein l3 containing protein [Stylonychia lemnae]|eukprot:CDW71541.1 ribosomal protein l3 containing protein [Stylonychia lemnae]
MLSQIIKRRLLQNTQVIVYNQSLFFSQHIVQPTMKLEDMTMTQIRELGHKNLAQQKIIDYQRFINPNVHGITNKKTSFTSFEDQVNANFNKNLIKTAPANRESRRVGLIGYKMGMTHFWNKWGALVPCTVIQIDRCQVTQVKTLEKDGVNAIQVGCGEERMKNLKKPQAGHYLKHNLPPKGDLAEFPVTDENFLPPGYMLGPRHFKIGQLVDVKSVSIGKGFQGVMKRWNFSGQNASHGNSVSHRHAGSIGNREYPGKVFKGKKMAGHLGNINCTIQNQMVVKIDVDRSLLYIQGNVPGPISALVRIRDAVKMVDKQYLNLEYPTWLPPTNEAEYKALPRQLVWDGTVIDPYEDYIHENDVVSGKDQEDD